MFKTKTLIKIVRPDSKSKQRDIIFNDIFSRVTIGAIQEILRRLDNSNISTLASPIVTRLKIFENNKN